MFVRAERKRVKLRMGLYGRTGAGKTYSSLEIFTGMGGKIAMIDTENGRGDLYGNEFEYYTIPISAPYTVEKYIKAIKLAEQHGFDNLLIDSLSHAWAGEGGVCSIVDKTTGNKFAGGKDGGGWKEATPLHNMLVETIMQSKMHIICSMRAKHQYDVETNEYGKKVPVKVGMGPVQRAGLDYEFMIFGEVIGEVTNIEKDDTGLFKDNKCLKLTKEVGKSILTWLNSGKSQEDIDNEKRVEIEAVIKSCASLDELKRQYINMLTKYPSMKDYVIGLKDDRKQLLEFTPSGQFTDEELEVA